MTKFIRNHIIHRQIIHPNRNANLTFYTSKLLSNLNENQLNPCIFSALINIV